MDEQFRVGFDLPLGQAIMINEAYVHVNLCKFGLNALSNDNERN